MGGATTFDFFAFELGFLRDFDLVVGAIEVL